MRDSRLPSADFIQKTTESRECLSHAAEGVCFYCLCTADKRILQSRSLKTVLSKNVPPEREEVEQRLENRGNSAIPCIAKPLPALEFRFRLRRDPARKFRCGRRIFPLLMLPADLHFTARIFSAVVPLLTLTARIVHFPTSSLNAVCREISPCPFSVKTLRLYIAAVFPSGRISEI